MSPDDDEDRDDNEDDVAEPDTDSDAEPDADTGGSAGAEAAPARDDAAELPSVEARRKAREQLEAEMEAFLKRGGKIEVVEPVAGSQGTSFTAGVNDLSQ